MYKYSKTVWNCVVLWGQFVFSVCLVKKIYQWRLFSPLIKSSPKLHSAPLMSYILSFFYATVKHFGIPWLPWLPGVVSICWVLTTSVWLLLTVIFSAQVKSLYASKPLIIRRSSCPDQCFYSWDLIPENISLALCGNVIRWEVWSDPRCQMSDVH